MAGTCFVLLRASPNSLPTSPPLSPLWARALTHRLGKKEPTLNYNPFLRSQNAPAPPIISEKPQPPKLPVPRALAGPAHVKGFFPQVFSRVSTRWAFDWKERSKNCFFSLEMVWVDQDFLAGRSDCFWVGFGFLDLIGHGGRNVDAYLVKFIESVRSCPAVEAGETRG